MPYLNKGNFNLPKSKMPPKGPLTYNFVSLNVKGINIPKKRSIALSFTKRQKAQSVFFQETHFKGSNHPRLHNQFFLFAFHATDPQSKKKGISILFAINFPLQNINCLTDPDGRYVFLTGTLGTKNLTLVNIYLPNVAQVEGLMRVMDELKSFAIGSIILGGDSNKAMDPRLDTSMCHSSLSFKTLGRAKGILQDIHLIDMW